MQSVATTEKNRGNYFQLIYPERKSEIKLLFVNQVLERGPPVYHQVVLGMLCALMRLADFSSPAMRHFQNEALKTIAKYLKVNTTS